MRLFFFIFTFICLPLISEAQFYYGLQTNFGKSRVQYKEFNWSSYQYKDFDIYYYRGGKLLANYIATTSHRELQNIEDKFFFNLEKRIQFIIYNTFSDFKQSNIGYDQNDDYNIGGRTQIVGTKVLLYFDGDYNHLNKQIRAGITNILLQEFMYGGNIADAFTNSALLNLPDWFIEGLVHFISEPWNLEIENIVKDKISTGDFKSFNHLDKEEAVIAGYSIWHYIQNTYGERAISDILYMIRLNRNIENSFHFVLGKSVNDINQEWLEYYFQSDVTGIYPSSKILPINIKEDEQITKIAISPKGRRIAFVTNEKGKYRIWLYDMRNKKQKKVITVGHKLDRITDLTVPVITFNPNSKILAFITEKRGGVQMNYYNINNHIINTFELQNLQKVMSMEYDKKGKVLVLSGIRNNASDIFTLEVVGNKLTNITNDKFLDLTPVFSSDNNCIIFSSNRNSSVLYENDNLTDYAKSNDLFKYNYKTESSNLIRLTNTHDIHETEPRSYRNNKYWFLSDKNGIKNRFILNVDSIKIESDSGVYYEKKIDIKPYSNYNRDIICYDIKPNSGRLVEVLYLNGKYVIYDNKLSRKIKETDIKLSKSSFLELRDNMLLAKSTLSKKRKDSLWLLNKVDIQNYMFGDFKMIRNNIANKDTVLFTHITRKKKEPKARNYFVAFNTNYIVSQFDNSYINKSYQPFTNYKAPIFLNPDFDALIKLGTADLFEDYKIIGGARLSGDLKNNGYVISFIDNKYRLDKSYSFSRQSISVLKDNALQKTFSYEFRAVSNWPFNEVFSTRNSISFRNDKEVYLATDNTNLRKENSYSNWVTYRNEIIFDNTINKGLNLYNGGRYKFFAEYYRLLEDTKSDMVIIGLDARNYKRIHHSIIWANRLAFSTSFGNQKLLYYMGGVDAWLTPKFNQDIDVSSIDNYSYQTLANNMRGFNQNIRNGNSFFLINTEIRIPLFKYLLRRPITSDVINNFQILTFLDFGTAWSGNSPFASNNQINYEVIENGPVTITLDKQKDPFIAGFGFGVRSRIFGYFLRADWAWGIEDGYLLPNILYISLGLDF